MAERSTISQVVQIGVESTPGTGVAANKRLRSLSIEPTPNAEVTQFRPAGTKYKTLTALNREWITANLGGYPTYDEIIYPLASVMDSPTHTALAGGGHQWEFLPSSTTEDTIKTFTVEQGSSVRAHKFTYGLVTEFGMTISRAESSLSGSMIGQRMTDGITMTSSPDELPLVPMLPTEWDVFVDPVFDDIGTTKLGRLLNVGWSLGSRFNPLWVIDSAKTSWAAHVETEPALEASLTVEANAEGMDYLNQLRDGSTAYLRLLATGPTVPAEAATDEYSFQLDMPFKIGNTGGFSDADGVYAVAWTALGVDDEDFGGAVSAIVVNSISAL